MRENDSLLWFVLVSLAASIQRCTSFILGGVGGKAYKHPIWLATFDLGPQDLQWTGNPQHGQYRSAQQRWLSVLYERGASDCEGMGCRIQKQGGAGGKQLEFNC